MEKRNITRRIALAGLTLPLASCADQTLYGLDLNTWGEALKITTGLEDRPGVTLDQASSVPYSSLGYRIGSQAERMLILATDNNGERLWTSSERRTLVTRGGRIVKSERMDFDLTASQFLSADPIAMGISARTAAGQKILRLCDFQDIGRYNIKIAGQIKKKDDEDITILGQTIHTFAVVENCESKDLHWKFQNEFWGDAETGFIWKSVQTIHPNMDPITIEILRPPA